MRTWHLGLVIAFLVGFPLPAFAQGAGIAPCGIPYQPNFATPSGHAVLAPPMGQPLIIYNPQFIAQAQMYGLGAEIFRYLMQHECGHHVLSHVVGIHMNPAAAMWMTPQIELQAECYAAKQLYASGDQAALMAAVKLWGSLGMAPTGPNYPTGIQRAQTLHGCFGP
jgi:hypothetical protein